MTLKNLQSSQPYELIYELVAEENRVQGLLDEYDTAIIKVEKRGEFIKIYEASPHEKDVQ